MDYDSNLLAVMAGVAARVPGRAEATLKRVDSGPCTHARATYVSEIYYNQSNCNGGNTGDSAVTMGRIAWLDGRARRLMGTKDAGEMARDVILAPLQEELLANTWMYERYQCGGEVSVRLEGNIACASIVIPLVASQPTMPITLSTLRW